MDKNSLSCSRVSARLVVHQIDDMHYDVTVKVTEVNGESTADLHLCMASITGVDPLVRPLVHWTVEQLKDFLRDRRLPVSGTKAELITISWGLL